MASKQPVTPLSTHRLFPAVVAIWFAALFGLGCAVLPASLIEAAIGATGLSAILPAAAPPLGFTAQALLAVAAAAFGALCGFVLARKVAAAQGAIRPAHEDARRPAAPRGREKPGARRPLSIKDELDDEPLFAPSFVADEAPAGRRRSLLPADELPPEPETLFDYAAVHEPFSADEPSIADPLPIAGPVAVEEVQPEDFHDSRPRAEASDPLPVDVPEPEEAAAEPATPAGILPSDPRADVAQMGIVQLTERLGHALQGRLDRGQLRPLAPPPALLAELAGLPPRPATPEQQPAPAPSSPPGSPLSSPLPFSGPDFGLEEIDPQHAVFGGTDIESAPPRSATFAPSMTEALRSATLQLDEFGEDEEEYEDETALADEHYGSLLAIKGLGSEPRDIFAETDETDETAFEDTGYDSSGYEQAAYGEEVRDSRPFDAQPPADQPHQQGQAEDETEALRRALARLQRVSGAA